MLRFANGGSRRGGEATVVENGLQIFDADGFGKVIVHARLKATVAILIRGIGRHGDDRHTAGIPRLRSLLLQYKALEG